MIKFEHTEVLGWKAAIRGLRNPLESWGKSDSTFAPVYAPPAEYLPDIGDNDLDLMMRLRKAGTDHRKFMRMIVCYVDITAPLYWWKEFDTYRNGVEKNSCSTMHCIHKKDLDPLEDFSVDFDGDKYGCAWASFSGLVETINEERELFLETKDKRHWYRIIQMLPSSYNQKRTCMISYEALANMYHARKEHKLDEWREGFCGWVRKLPYSELITGEER